MVVRTGITVDISGLLKKFNNFSTIVEEEAASAITELTEEGARIARLALNNAETDWGRWRFEDGKGISSGRNDTGRMRNSLRALGVNKDGQGNISGKIGWRSAQKYFAAQELGTAGNEKSMDQYDPNFDYASAYASRARGWGVVQGAHSLWTARAEMERQLPKTINKLRKNIRKRIESQ